MFEIIKPSDAKFPNRYVNKFFIHCSAADHEGDKFEGSNLAETIDRWHRERGFSCIGYHFVIDKKGQLIKGRDLHKTPAAQAFHNIGTIAVCLHGLKEDKFTEAQFETLRKLALRYDDLYDGRITFHGHKEVARKACPVFDYKKVLKLNEKGELGI